MSKKLVFKEFDVTNMPKEHLTKIFWTTHNDSGWCKKMENLEMVVLGDDRIIVRGWATRRMFEKFYKNVINDFSLDYLFVEWKPEDLGF